MSFERSHTPSSIRFTKRSQGLASSFKEVASSKVLAYPAFHNMEEALEAEGFSLGNADAVSQIFENNRLLCRSESFSKIMDLLLDGEPLEVQNENYQANMCLMASSSGFRIAMVEGFAGDDVGNIIKTVITFRGEHLTSRDSIPHNAELWKTKPKTAQVSFAGSGTVTLDDVAMVSFRVPVHYFPEELLTETERDALESADIKFIVRHYVPDNEKAAH